MRFDKSDMSEEEKRVPGERRGTKSILKPSKYADTEAGTPLLDEAQKEKMDIADSYEEENTSKVMFRD